MIKILDVKRNEFKILNSKSKAISVMYLCKIIQSLEVESEKSNGVEKTNIENDINCLNDTVAYLNLQ